MPFSVNQGKNEIERWYRDIALMADGSPLRVLDIGVGSGTYARLLRTPEHPAADWTGIEIWAPYIEQFALPAVYDRILVGDARTIVAQIANNPLEGAGERPYDVVFAGDVLEHMPVMDAANLVENLKRISRYLVVSVPIVHWEQGAYEGNPYEAHVHHYTAEEMRSLLTGAGGYNFLYQSLHSEVGCWLWASAETAERRTELVVCATCDGGGCPDCTG